MANLMQASHQWQNRPADERYWGLTDMLAAARTLRAESSEVEIPRHALRAAENPGDPGDIGIYTGSGFVSCTHYAFNTLAARAGAPAEYMRRLKPEMAITCLNEGLATVESDSVALIRQNGTTQLRAITSQRYGRVWYDDTIASLQRITEGSGWMVPPARPAVDDPRARPATEADVIPSLNPLSVRVGDMIAPAGCYLSDRDLFIFMIDPSRTFEVNGRPLSRGFFLANSEVRARVYSIVTYLFDSVCGNHIVWGAENVQEFKVKHLGDRAEYRALQGSRLYLDKYTNSSNAETEKILKLAATYELGKDEPEVLERVQDYINRKRLPIPAKVVAEAQEIALHGEYGNPRTAWAMVGAMTEIARDMTYTDERSNLERAASKIIDIVR